MILFLSCHTNPPKEYLIDELDLVPEGIAYSKEKDLFYVTSVAKSKIITVDRLTGEQKDFIEPNEFGYMPGVGILVDDKRNRLHALGGYYITDTTRSSLFTFDINTQELIGKYDMTDDGNHFLNDLIQDDEGNIYLTNTKDSSVYWLEQGSQELKLFFRSKEIQVPNGIAISKDNTKLYIASIVHGVRILDLKSRALLNQRDPTSDSKGIDGLEWFDGHLFGIQNSAEGNPFNFRKLILNDAKDRVVNFEVIASDAPQLDVPLTFCIEGNNAVVIDNSNLDHLNQETFEFSDDPSILKTKLLVYSIQ